MTDKKLSAGEVEPPQTKCGDCFAYQEAEQNPDVICDHCALPQQPECGEGLEVVVYFTEYGSDGEIEREYNGLPEMSCGRIGEPLVRLADAQHLLSTEREEAERKMAEKDAEIARLHSDYDDACEDAIAVARELNQSRARVTELSDNAREGSAAQKAFWHGFETAFLAPDESSIRHAWNEYKASEQFTRLNPPQANSQEGE